MLVDSGPIEWDPTLFSLQSLLPISRIAIFDHCLLAAVDSTRLRVVPWQLSGEIEVLVSACLRCKILPCSESNKSI